MCVDQKPIADVYTWDSDSGPPTMHMLRKDEADTRARREFASWALPLELGGTSPIGSAYPLSVTLRIN